MKIQETYNNKLVGHIEVFVLQDGVETVLLSRKNLIVDSGMDLLAKAVSGKAYINGMYIAYSNAASPLNESSPTVDRSALYYQTTGSDATKSFMRVALAAEPTITSSDALTYNGNKASFIAIGDGNVAVPIPGNEITPGTSLVYGAALVYMDPDDMANDVMYAAVTFADLIGVLEEVPIVAGAQVGIRWAQTFVN
jgi:hypothetical protein